jgi:hypothetical protein
MDERRAIERLKRGDIGGLEALVLAVLSMMILGVVVYVAAGPLQGPARHGPPTGEKPANQSRGGGPAETLKGNRSIRYLA